MTQKDYQKLIPAGTHVPNHVAIIPDGNRRWAKTHGLPTFDGHKKGFDIAPELARAARAFGVHTLTIWAFSTENWKRSPDEVDYLMQMYEKFIDKNLEECVKDKARLIHLGRKDRIPALLRDKIINAEEKTQNFTKNILNVALDYGGHDEILRATQKIIKDLKGGKLDAAKLEEVVGLFHNEYPMYFYKEYLDTHNQPYPYVDLIIRTSNEKRTSGFLPWQLVYAEYFWEKDHFPDFTPEKLAAAIIDFSSRQRRFGGEHQEKFKKV